MVTSIVLISLIGTLQFNSAISAAINYEPIKITVNENFNAQPGQVSPELQGREPGVLHQGANCYFKPQLNLPPSYIPSHIEPLISLIQEHHHSCAKDTSKIVVQKDKLIEILKPFMYPVSDSSKETLSEIVLENENNVDILKPIIITKEPKPGTTELLLIPGAPVLPPRSHHDISSIMEEEVKKEESITLEEPTGVFPTISGIAVRPVEKPIINYVEPKPAVQELSAIPEASVLLPLPLHDISFIIGEEVKKEESVISEEPTVAFATIPEPAMRPIPEPIINYVEPKPITSELVIIPETPVLMPLSPNGIRPIVEEEVKKEESITLEEPTGVFPTLPEIAVRPITKPIINYVEPKPITPELLVISEATVLSPVSLHDITSIIEKEVKKEESITLEEPTGVFPTIPGIAVRPIEEPIINYVKPKSVDQVLVAIPEAPVLPPLSLHDISYFIEEEIKKEKSITLEEPMGVFPIIPGITVRPIEEPFINYVEPKPAGQELVAIPEALVLPKLTRSDPYTVDEVEKEKSVILEEPTGVFPSIPEISTRPETVIVNFEPKPAIQEPLVIPKAPVLSPLTDIPVDKEVKLDESTVLEESIEVSPPIPEISVRLIRPEPIIMNVEPKPITSELVVIPEAPVLPPLSYNGIPSVIEELKIEELKKVEESTGVIPSIPEISVRPITKPIINYVEPKPITPELLVISEATVLSPVSLHDISSIIEEEMKKEESITLEEPTGVFPTIPGIAVIPIEEPIINYVKPKSVDQVLVAIPEAPVLPPLSLHDISYFIEEEIKKEKSITLEEPMGVFPIIPGITVRPIEEPFINYVEPKPAGQELVAIPEALVLPKLTRSDPYTVDEVEKEKSVILEEPTGVFPSIPEISTRPETVIVNFEAKPAIQELLVIPKAPVLSPLTDIPVVKEVKLDESTILEESIEVSPPIPEISVRLIRPEPIIMDVEPKPITSELVVIPEAPALPPLSYNGIPSVIEELKIEELKKVEESTGVIPSIPEISARPLPEPLVVSETAESFALENNIFPVATEEVKIEIPVLLEESIEVFPPIAEISSGPTLQESEITDCYYVMEEVSQPNPENVITVKETLPPTIIQKPSNNLGVFSYVPFLSHLSNRAPKIKKLVIPKPASPERFLLKKHPFKLPVTSFSKLDLNAIKSSTWGNKKQFLYPTSYAHDVVEKRIPPNMAFKKQNGPKRVKIDIHSNFPKGPR